MPSEDTKILEFNHYQKSDKASFITYTDLECIIEKTDEWWFWKFVYNKSKRTYSTRFFNVYNILSRSIENKHDIYRGNDIMKKFWEP